MASIQGVYVALFGRPADPLGLAFFNQATNNGANLTAVGDLASTAEYQSRFAGQSSAQIINSIYKSLFNRDADLAGLTFFAAQLSSGALNIKNIAIAIFDGAQGTDITTRDLKVAAANAFTTALDTAPEVLAYQGIPAANSGVAFLTGVTTTAPTQAAIDASIAAIVTQSQTGGGVTGKIFTLDTAAEVFAPNAATAAFVTTAGDDTFRANVTKNSLTSADSIDAGGGNDTINVTGDVATGTAIQKPVLNNLENVFLTQDTNAGTYDFGDSKGVVAVWNNASTIGLTAQGLALTTTAGLTGTLAEASTFTYSAAAAGTNDTATLALREAAVATGKVVTIANIENLNISQSDIASTTGNVSFVDALAVAATKSIVVSGEGTLTIGGAAGSNFTALTKFDASTHKGDMTLDFNTAGTAPTAGVTVLASSAGVNSIVLKAANGLADVIAFTAGNVSTISKMTTVSNFVEAAQDKLDLKAFALGADTTVGATNVAVAGDISGFFTGTARVVLNDASDIVYVDTNKDGNFSAGTDLAVKLTGVSAAGFTAADLTLA